MRPLKSFISLDEAKRIINENSSPLSETESVPLVNLNGRVSAEDVVAESNVPPFRRAAMDGYAIKAKSTFTASEKNPLRLHCIDVIHAGEVSKEEIGENQCITINI